MPKQIFQVPEGQQVVLLGDKVQFVDSAITAPKSRSVGQPVEGDGGDSGTGRGIIGSLVGGMVDTAIALGWGYPESAYAAIKYRFLAEIGIRPPKSEYALAVSRKQRKEVRREAARDVSIALGETQNSNALAKVMPTETGREVRKNVKLQKKLVESLVEEKLQELAKANDYYGNVVEIINHSGVVRQDPQGLYFKAIETMKGKTHQLTEAFVSGQAVAGDSSQPITEVERMVATTCVQAERKSGVVWDADRRKAWVMAYLTEMAKNAVVETGASLVEREEINQLNKLDISGSNIGDIEEGDRVLLHVPSLDIAFAEQLGGGKAMRGMNFGVDVILTPGNKIKVKYLTTKETVAAGPESLDTDVIVSRGAGLIADVQAGDYGGPKWKNFINTILGDEQNRLPLAGVLILSSTEKRDKPIVIPTLNPGMAEEILSRVKGAVQIIGARTKQIAGTNPLVQLPDESVPGVAAKITARKIETLPSYRKILSLAGRSISRIHEEQLSAEVVTADEIAHVELLEKPAIGKDYTRLAQMVITNADSARAYMRERRKRVSVIMDKAGDSGVDYIRAFDLRARELLADDMQSVPQEYKRKIVIKDGKVAAASASGD